MTMREMLRILAEGLDSFVAEHDYCVFCTLVCPLAHDHHTEDERYCVYSHADDCYIHALRALADRMDAEFERAKYPAKDATYVAAGVLARLDAAPSQSGDAK